jgi:hypothetical protein
LPASATFLAGHGGVPSGAWATEALWDVAATGRDRSVVRSGDEVDHRCMYLVHARLRGRTDQEELPTGVASVLRAAAGGADRLEHVAVHPWGARPDHVLGLFLASPTLRHAELAARGVCLRALADDPRLARFRLIAVEAVMVPQALDAVEWDEDRR